MRIAIVTTQCPFVTGGAELHAEQLKLALHRAGHAAEIISIPYKWYPPESILDHMLAARSFNISEFNGVKIDLAICLKFPAYLIRHPNKVFWILHQERAAYDLWDRGLSDFFHSDNGEMIRAAVQQADGVELRNARRIFANSENVAKRLLHYNGIEAEALYHPPPLAPYLRCDVARDYFYYPSRITKLKRQDFVLHALARTKTNAKVVFSGAFDSPDSEKELRKLAFELGLQERVEWRGHVEQADMITLYAHAQGVLYTPVDEDLGYVALETMAASKPLLTLSDAGEPANLIQHDHEGLVSEPSPESYARLIDRAMNDGNYLLQLGRNARSRYDSLDVSWEKAVARLIAPAKEKPFANKREQSISIAGKSGRIFAGWQAATSTDGSVKQRHSVVPLSSMRSEKHLEDLFERYDFGESFAGAHSYFKTHWRRYQSTLDILQARVREPRRILDLGISAPYLFTALLKELFPQAEFFGVQERQAGRCWTEKVHARNKDLSDITINLAALNIETTALPFEDETFDLVLGMEILEHFAIDPSFVFREAARVTRASGQFLISSPNIVSSGAIQRALNGNTPYSFGVFVPWNGVYGRHNREYTPHEVEDLGRYAGFETSLLETRDVYDQEELADGFIELLGSKHPLELRGQNIFYMGCKQQSGLDVPYPKSLFVVDPAIFEGQLEIIRSSETDGFLLRVTNKSSVLWTSKGESRVKLCVDRIDQSGKITSGIDFMPLPCDLAPQDEVELAFSSLKSPRESGAWYEIGLYLEGIGPFKEAGRSNTVSIFAETIKFNESGRLRCA